MRLAAIVLGVTLLSSCVKDVVVTVPRPVYDAGTFAPDTPPPPPPPPLCRSSNRPPRGEVCPVIHVPYVGPTEMTTERCVPYASRACTCRAGAPGYQRCDEGEWGPCLCTGADLVDDSTAGTVTRGAPVVLSERLIAPLSGFRVTSQRPTLRWQLPAGVMQAAVELCGDRDCARVLHAAEVTGNLWRTPDCLEPGVVFWRVRGLRADRSTAWTSATWEFSVRHGDSYIDSVLGPMRDMNGDGYDDGVIDMARPVDQGALIVHGGDGAAQAVPQTADEKVTSDDHVRIGDVNGDGRADLLALSDYWRMALFHGDAACSQQFVRRLSRIAGEGASVDVGDFDGDGFGDVLIVSYEEAVLYRGSRSGLEQEPAGLIRHSLATIGACVFLGDVDGDGYGDFAVSLYVPGPVVWILFGNPAARLSARVQTVLRDSSQPLLKASDASSFGRELAGADFNGDGYADLAVSGVEGIFYHQGSPRGLTFTRFLGAYSGGAIIPMGMIGDLTGDGLPDLLALGHAQVFVATRRDGLPDTVSFEVEQTWPINLLGDLDGDGSDEVYVQRNNDFGAMFPHVEALALNLSSGSPRVVGSWRISQIER